jgi:hypothetical protein
MMITNEYIPPAWKRYAAPVFVFALVGVFLYAAVIIVAAVLISDTVIDQGMSIGFGKSLILSLKCMTPVLMIFAVIAIAAAAFFVQGERHRQERREYTAAMWGGITTSIRSVEGQIAAPPAAPRIQAPAPTWTRVDDTRQIRTERVDDLADQIFERLYPHTSPTQANVKSLIGATDNTAISDAMSRLLARGVAYKTSEGKGAAWRWLNEPTSRGDE